MNKKIKKLSPLNLGLSGGVIWGVSLFLLTLISLATGYAQDFLDLITKIYPGYEPSFTGSLIGLFLGFLDGFIALYLFGLLYNWLSRKKNKSK